jgi:diacylglycerol O-acyltransferase/trehalose O-mycolyltransferase
MLKISSLFRPVRPPVVPLARPPARPRSTAAKAFLVPLSLILTLVLSFGGPASAGAAPPAAAPQAAAFPAAASPAAAAAADLAAGRSLSSDTSVLRVRQVGDRMLDVTLRSSALGREGNARILVPPGYARSPVRRWPVLYLLHGCCALDPGWTLWTTQTDVDRQTARYNALVVMPDGGVNGFYSDWWNRGKYGPPAWETFHLDELWSVLEDRLRAQPAIAIAGFSMGGLGALAYAARHPGTFRAAASYSGLTDSLAASDDVLAILKATGEDLQALWGDPQEHATIWREHNPIDLDDRLRGMPVYVASGNGQPGPLDSPDQKPDPLEESVGRMNARYVEQARAHGVRLTAHLYGAGTHTWAYWERELRLSLPLLMGAIGADSGATPTSATDGPAHPSPTPFHRGSSFAADSARTGSPGSSSEPVPGTAPRRQARPAHLTRGTDR